MLSKVRLTVILGANTLIMTLNRFEFLCEDVNDTI